MGIYSSKDGGWTVNPMLNAGVERYHECPLITTNII